MHFRSVIVSALALVAMACGDNSAGPTITPAAKAAIARFDFLADSAANAGSPDEAQLYTGAAEAVRIAGDIGTIPVSIDGTSTDFYALTLQLTLPAQSYCDEFGCDESPAIEESFLIAWQEEPTDRMLLVAKEGFGARSLAFDTTAVDTMTGPPPGVAVVGDESGEGWFSIAGTTSNQAVSSGGACAKPRQETPGVRYSCVHATYRWSADFTAGEAEGDAIGTEHHVIIPSTEVTGAKLAFLGFTEEIGAQMGKAPIRSRLVLKRDRARARAAGR